MRPDFQHDLGDKVAIEVSGEEGVVIGRAEFESAEPSYLVRYKNGEGCALESWWTSRALKAVA